MTIAALYDRRPVGDMHSNVVSLLNCLAAMDLRPGGPILQDEDSASGQADRPALVSLFKSASNKEFEVLVVHSMNRLAISLTDLLYTAGHLNQCGIHIYFCKEQIYTAEKKWSAFFEIAELLASFESATIIGRINAGLVKARSRGAHLGRPRIGAEKEEQIRALIRQRLDANGKIGYCAIAKQLKVGVSAIQRIKAEMGI